MATFSKSSLATASEYEKLLDVCCSICTENSQKLVAEFFCETCVKFYCGKCNDLHGQLYKKHIAHGRTDRNRWPVSQKVEDFLLNCEVCKEKKVVYSCCDLSCLDSGQLYCHDCRSQKHSNCNRSNVSDSFDSYENSIQMLKSQESVQLVIDEEKMPRNKRNAKDSFDSKARSIHMLNPQESVQSVIDEIKMLQKNSEAKIESLQISFDEQLKAVKEQICIKIKDILERIENISVKEMNDALTSLQDSLKNNILNCTRLQDDLNQLVDVIEDVSCKGKDKLTFYAKMKCLNKIEQSKKYLKNSSTNIECSFNLLVNSDIERDLSHLSELDWIVCSTRVLTVKGKSVYYKISRDLPKSCKITAARCLPDGKMVLADYKNTQILLLDRQYNMITNCKVSAEPHDICVITPFELAVALRGEWITKEIQFISLIGTQLVTSRKIPLKHDCTGISYHEGDMFITSGSALFKYSLSGKLVEKLFEDKTGVNTVNKCAAIHNKLYITNSSQHKLITLAMDGSILAVFTDPDLRGPCGIDVKPEGQVLVCGSDTSVIIQVDSEGKNKLATLATSADGLNKPLSVCYNRNISSIIVGQDQSFNILVFQVQ